MNRPSEKRAPLMILFVWCALLAVCVLGLLFGSVSLSLSQVVTALFGGDKSSTAALLVHTVRLPRVLAGAGAGIGLSVAGVILQSVMNNSLASPGTIGVNSGAGLAVMLLTVFLPQLNRLLPLAAFVGALGTTLLIFALAYKTGASRVTIVLAGVAISSMASACINALKLLHPDAAINSMTFMVGSLSSVYVKQLIIPLPVILIFALLSWAFAPALNLLGLGDDVAASLGLRVKSARLGLIFMSSVLAGCVVSYAGLLGFVGLLVPHLCRRLVGGDARYLIPCSAGFGGSLVVLSDLLGRVLFAPYELPVGILMSLLGGPFFLYLLLRKKGGRLHA